MTEDRQGERDNNIPVSAVPANIPAPGNLNLPELPVKQVKSTLTYED